MVICKFLTQALGIPTICFTPFTNLKPCALGFFVFPMREFSWLMKFIHTNLVTILANSSTAVSDLFSKNIHNPACLAEFRGV